ncbi:Gmad2 immunoglobulin-like domain-containing protein [Flavobacterium glaciei]|uniref:Immunoglobulin-like protein involved in spore germination n=1 Tax=Flavobacterium glaciei TaxID=386300 RepID=A0A562Q1L6_9FLAO|nr:Gmad2 immunoglobulin-like domain-containing protein [Flavobacterium glaciei]RDI57609.1 immunoglobulin-like protein involved in spore germination [Flavobacterium glaciei]TWI50591.1 immunoglobulin-like protein involved in spore germination [Flavobacterium glaciei]
MRWTILLSAFLLFACNKKETQRPAFVNDTLMTIPDTTKLVKATKPENLLPKQYSNARFKEVTVERIDENKFRVRGKGQIFEANFNWIIEDGHDELHKGFQMTDAGAPEWGNFDFTVTVEKKRENSKLTLVLFESSAKAGSRQHELPILLF